MFARIERVRDGKVFIDGKEYTLEEVKKLKIFKGLGKDDEGNLYVVLGNG